MTITLRNLFEQYRKLDTPFIISAFLSDGRREMFVIIGSDDDGGIIGVSRNTPIPAHLNPLQIVEWRDYSGNKTNIISTTDARAIYEKYFSNNSVKDNPEKSNDPARSESHEGNEVVGENGQTTGSKKI